MHHLKDNKDFKSELEARNSEKYYAFVAVEIDSPFKTDNTVHYIQAVGQNN